MSARIGIVGGRGYTGAELLKLIAGHPGMTLAFASSSSQAGLPLRSACAEWPEPSDQFVELNVHSVASQSADAWVLAVPNGAAAGWARAIQDACPDAVVLDLSADHRFDKDWWNMYLLWPDKEFVNTALAVWFQTVELAWKSKVYEFTKDDSGVDMTEFEKLGDELKGWKHKSSQKTTD